MTQKPHRTTKKGNGAKATGARAKAAAAAPTAKRRRGRPTRQEQTERAQTYEAAEGDHVIHRYGNRRFYDLAARRAVTLDEVAAFVRRGDNVRVIDVDNGNEDITRRVLTQIILEEGNREKLELLPVEFLRKLIAAQDESVAPWLDQYLRAGAEMLDRGLKSGTTAFVTFQNEMNKMVKNTLGVVSREKTPYADILREQQREQADKRRDEIEELRRRLEELARGK